MDVLERRREIRKAKILQNAKDRLKKVTTVHAEAIQNGHNSLKPTVPDTGESKNGLTDSVDFESYSAKHEGTCTASEQDMPIEGKTENRKKDRIVEQTDKRKVPDKMTTLNPLREEGETNASDVQKTTEETTPRLRVVLVIVCATLSFYQSSYWPLITQATGFFELGKVQQQSFLIPFCLLELFFFCLPTARKVVPGKKVKLWLLALQLCGLSSMTLGKLRFFILAILEFLTDLALFIFILCILQNITELTS